MMLEDLKKDIDKSLVSELSLLYNVRLDSSKINK